jgi:hypothetical protein
MFNIFALNVLKDSKKSIEKFKKRENLIKIGILNHNFRLNKSVFFYYFMAATKRRNSGPEFAEIPNF